MNITRAILKLRIEYAIRFEMRPAEINNGNCIFFAEKIAKQGFGDAIWGNEVPIEYWTDVVQTIGRDNAEYFMSIHCLIYYEGKFYDSETPQGCDYPDHLLCYQRNIDLLDSDYEEPDDWDFCNPDIIGSLTPTDQTSSTIANVRASDFTLDIPNRI